MNYESDRNFQVWDYHVSHARLLIRSPSSGSSMNQDIIFYSVDFLNIPSSFRGLSLTILPRDEAESVGIPADIYGHSTTFRLETEERFYYVIAFACRIFENELDLFDSSLGDLGAGTRPTDLGRLLAHS